MTRRDMQQPGLRRFRDRHAMRLDRQTAALVPDALAAGLFAIARSSQGMVRLLSSWDAEGDRGGLRVVGNVTPEIILPGGGVNELG